MASKVHYYEESLRDKNNVIKKLEKELLNLKTDMEKAYVEEKKTKDSIIHDLKARIDSLTKQNGELKRENQELKDKDDDDREQEIRNLIHDNTILNEE